jgi:hypothetical protein
VEHVPSTGLDKQQNLSAHVTCRQGLERQSRRIFSKSGMADFSRSTTFFRNFRFFGPCDLNPQRNCYVRVDHSFSSLDAHGSSGQIKGELLTPTDFGSLRKVLA